MAILKGNDGQFYSVPDAQLNAMRVAGGQVKSQLTASAADEFAKQKEAEDAVTPHGFCRPRWRNCWRRNCWHNCWR